jgi:cell division cycle 14
MEYFSLTQNRTFTPSDYVPTFKKLGVTTVVRLNNKTYESEDFKKKGICHHDLYFPDGSVPSLEIVHKFIDIAES